MDDDSREICLLLDCRISKMRIEIFVCKLEYNGLVFIVFDCRIFFLLN